MQTPPRMKIAVVGTGISGLSAAWLLSRDHEVIVYERSGRVGGHSNTVSAVIGGGIIPVDTGFIVFNRATYPNLTKLFEHLGVPTQTSNMSFGVSLDNGNLEYSGGDVIGLLAQPANLFRRRFWSMLADINRFYREAARDADSPDFEKLSLGEYLSRGRYGHAFRDDHLLPLASAIWSATPSDMLGYPMASFIRFHANHGLLQISGRPVWETVSGGSITYIRELLRPLAGCVRLNTQAASVRRFADRVLVVDQNGAAESFDHVVLATHADQALSALADPSPLERSLLGTIRYSRNLAVLHSDETLMPKRRAAWASWNYIGPRTAAHEGGCFTYWMNSLQNIPNRTPLFVTLNPTHQARSETVHHSEYYDHPIFDLKAVAAQRKLWALQDTQRTWFCGAYFGYGFHEDGLQAGLAVAEQLGNVRRPWSVDHESGRIFLSDWQPRPGVAA
jgi:predicted NAD/FAD-binding protein